MVKLIFLIVLILCSLNLSGQNTPKTILWEVTNKDTKFKSYLFGTLHEADSAFFASLAKSVGKLKASDIVYVEETNNSATDSTNMLLELSVWSQLKWEALLSIEQKKIFESFIAKAERSDYYNLPPLILNRTLVGVYLSEFCDSNAANRGFSLDSYIEKLATQYKKPVSALDENQVSILKTVSLSVDSARNLEYAKNCTDFMSKMLNDDYTYCNLITQYKSFDIDYELDKDLTQVKNYSPLLIDRNNNWIKILNKSLGKYNCFIAVGLRHLFYQQGLIQQLRALGFAVKPVRP